MTNPSLFSFLSLHNKTTNTHLSSHSFSVYASQTQNHHTNHGTIMPRLHIRSTNSSSIYSTPIFLYFLFCAYQLVCILYCVRRASDRFTLNLLVNGRSEYRIQKNGLRRTVRRIYKRGIITYRLDVRDYQIKLIRYLVPT